MHRATARQQIDLCQGNMGRVKRFVFALFLLFTHMHITDTTYCQHKSVWGM